MTDTIEREYTGNIPGWRGADRVYSRAYVWCQRLADAHFTAWCQTSAGRRWKRLRGTSPYDCGFIVREDVQRMIEALNKGDEETIKAFLLHYPGGV